MKKQISVMLIEDNREYRDVIEFALSKEPGMDLVSHFSTAEIALRTLSEPGDEAMPDLVLLDLQLPGMSGLDAMPELLRLLPKASVVVLSNSDSEADVVAAIGMGAHGYLLKSSTIDHILDGIRSVTSGGALLDPGVARYIMNHVKPASSNPQQEESGETLTEREIEILKYMGEGLVKKEIGDLLKISYFTVDAHVRNIYLKMHVRNAPAAITKAYKIKLFSPD